MSQVLRINVLLIPLAASILQVASLSHQLAWSAGLDDSCNARQVNGDVNKIVCVCNEQFCSDLRFQWPEKAGTAHLVQSSRAGRRFDVSNLNYQQLAGGASASHKIRVNLSDEHQTILGWGGAFTDAFGINLSNLTEHLSNRLIESYFGANGLLYNFGRVPIGGSDFSSRPYTYDDSEKADFELANWALAPEDHQFKIPVIKKAINASEAAGVQLKLMSSPWSPPKWMKTNNGFARGYLKDEDRVYQSYTNYLMKFYDAYANQSISFWGATVQNEPIASFMPVYFFNSLQIGTKQMIKFIGHYLGPALTARGWTKDRFKLIVGDDSLGFINLQVPAMLADERVQKYVSGLAFHWYLSGSIVPYGQLTNVYEAVKDKIEFMMMSEACAGSMPLQKKVDLGSWDRGELYGADIIEDLLRETNAWIDWNMALDMRGGPNWAKNFVDSPILVDGNKNEFYKQPMYYVLAHFSRLFRPGSVRVGTSIKRCGMCFFAQKIMTVAVHNKDTGHLIINILNKSSSPQRIDISLERNFHLKTFEIEGKSMNSVVIKL